MKEGNHTFNPLHRCGLLPMLVLICGLAGYSVLAITFGEPDNDQHPNVGALMVQFPDGVKFPVCSGTLIYRNATGRGVFLTAGHCITLLQQLIDEGLILPSDVTVNFNSNPYTGTDVVVTAMYPWLVARPNFADWDDMGLLVLQADASDSLPEIAQLAPVGFLDSLSQQQLRGSQLVAVGYGGSLLFPPPQVVYYDQRQFSTPQYLNLVGRSIKLQVNGPAGNSGVLFGDSGGPLFWRDPITGTEWIVAICHGGYGQFNSTVVHYRVDTTAAHAFIQEIMTDTDSRDGASVD
jgi:hypothetical protein